MAKDTKGRRRLGRGLTSLVSSPVRIHLPEHEPDTPEARPPVTGTQAPESPESRASTESPDFTDPQAPRAATDPIAEPGGPAIRMIEASRIRPSPNQPRQEFDEPALAALAESIRSAGLMQPIVIRPAGQGDAGDAGRVEGSRGTGGADFELIAGERRWRAAQRIGLTSIPAVVHDITDEAAAEWSLIENLQREDLNAIERAEAFARLASQFGLSHQQIAERVGLDRSTVSNHLRLLELDAGTQAAVRSGTLTMGHARALLAIANIELRSAIAAEAGRQQWSVRELERRARDAGDGRGGTSEAEETGQVRFSQAAKPPHLKDLERRLGEHLGTKVTIRQGRRKGSGSLTIEFYSLDQFEGLLEQMRFAMDA